MYQSMEKIVAAASPECAQLVLGLGGNGLRLAKELKEALAGAVQGPATLAAVDSDQGAAAEGIPFFLLGRGLPDGAGLGAGGSRQRAQRWMVEQMEAFTSWLAPMTQGPVDIWLTAGTGGGTGSGCLLTVAYLLRHLTAQQKDTTLRCCLTGVSTAGWSRIAQEMVEDNSSRSRQEMLYCFQLPAADQVEGQPDPRPLTDGCWFFSDGWQPMDGRRETLEALLAQEARS